MRNDFKAKPPPPPPKTNKNMTFITNSLIQCKITQFVLIPMCFEVIHSEETRAITHNTSVKINRTRPKTKFFFIALFRKKIVQEPRTFWRVDNCPESQETGVRSSPLLFIMFWRWGLEEAPTLPLWFLIFFFSFGGGGGEDS